MELAKTVLAFTLGISRGATVVTFVHNSVSIPPRPKALGPAPAHLCGSPVGTGKASSGGGGKGGTGRIVPL
jgi:hypothetical protein